MWPTGIEYFFLSYLGNLGGCGTIRSDDVTDAPDSGSSE